MLPHCAAGCATSGCCNIGQQPIMKAFPNAKRMLERLLWQVCVQPGCSSRRSSSSRSSRMWSTLEARVVFQLTALRSSYRLPLATCLLAACLLPLPAAAYGIKTKLFPPTRKKRTTTGAV